MRVENLASNILQDMLELYIEKWAGPAKDITVFREEQAAIVTFHAPEGKTCCLNELFNYINVNQFVYLVIYYSLL